jgi:hypothetical protein
MSLRQPVRKNTSYSPDVAPSDVPLLGSLKQRLQTCESRSFEELQGHVSEILNRIAPDELKKVQRGRIDRFPKVRDLSGEYARCLNC